jgi:predicted nucleic acid-binding protein
VIYLDSSVALAHLFTEPRMPAAGFWNQPIISSRLLEYEVWSRIHAHGCGLSHGERARALIGRVRLLELSPQVLARALEPFSVPLRTLDALHLATMEFIRSRGQLVELASYDKRLLTGARALGIPLMIL